MDNAVTGLCDYGGQARNMINTMSFLAELCGADFGEFGYEVECFMTECFNKIRSHTWGRY